MEVFDGSGAARYGWLRFNVVVKGNILLFMMGCYVLESAGYSYLSDLLGNQSLRLSLIKTLITRSPIKW